MKFYKIFAIVFIFVLLTAGFAAAAEKPIITADKTYYDIETGLYVLDGNVYIEARNRIITAGYARVSVTSMEVWASKGIKLRQDGLDFSGGSVYVYGSQRYAKIDGGANFEIPGLSITSDKAEYNWKSKIATFNGNVNIHQNGKVWQAEKVVYNVETKSFV